MPQAITTEPLAQMLRSIALQKRTGMLRVGQLGERNTEQGEIYFENGRPLRARAGQETGKAALQRIGAWKRVTCSFQGMSRPYPAMAYLSSQSRARKTEERLPVEFDPQTGQLPRSADLADTGRHQIMRAPREKTTYALNPRQTESIESTEYKSSIQSLPIHDNQPLILHGSSLERYEPLPVSQSPRSVQRWTTHLLSEMETLRMPPKSPATSRQDAAAEEGTLPGRQAIYRARAMVMTAEAIHGLERHARIVFILLDGRRTIQDIARLTHQTERDVEQILLDLTRHGYTEYIYG